MEARNGYVLEGLLGRDDDGEPGVVLDRDAVGKAERAVLLRAEQIRRLKGARELVHNVCLEDGTDVRAQNEHADEDARKRARKRRGVGARRHWETRIQAEPVKLRGYQSAERKESVSGIGREMGKKNN